MKTTLIASFLAFSVILAGAVLAEIPCEFFGTAMIGSSRVNGSLVTAHLITGEYLASAVELGGFGNYYIYIGNASNINVKFKVAGIWANEPEQKCVPGDFTPYYNLTATPLANGSSCSYNVSCSSGFCVHGVCRQSSPFPGDGFCDAGEVPCTSLGDCPCSSEYETCVGGSCQMYCGNGRCDNGETCSTCLGDCGECPRQTSGSSGGGGGSYTPPAPKNTTQSSGTTIVNNTTVGQGGATNQNVVIEDATPNTQSSNDSSQTETSPASPGTAFFLEITTGDWMTAIVLGIAVAAIIVFLAKKKRSKKSAKVEEAKPNVQTSGDAPQTGPVQL
jgi:hypothetical protein